MTADELLRAERLVVGRRVPLLTGVELLLRPGECWFVLGRNGAGKTTLLHTLAGLLPPLGGELRRRDTGAVGFVPQEPPVAPSLPLTVGEFVALGLADRRLPRADLLTAVAAALQAIGLGARSPQPLRDLSVGQRRRALIARALVRQPQLLLLDEPGANLDPGAAQQLARDLERLRAQQGIGLLYGSHDLLLARAFATHLAVLDGARVHAGPAAGLFAAGVVERALGTEAFA